MRTLQSPPPGLFYYINKHPPPRLPFGIKITSFHSFFGEARESCICLFPGIKETWQINSPGRRNTLLLRSLPGPRVFITGRISSVFTLHLVFFVVVFRHVSTLRESLQGGAAELSVVQPFRRALDIFHQVSRKATVQGREWGRCTPTLWCV